MATSKRFLPPIPKGSKILCGGVDVAGIHPRKSDAIAFIKGKDHALEIHLEPKNQFDPNAIAVFGITKGFSGPKRRKIGYIPAEIAKSIADGAVFSSISPRLRQIRLGDDGYCAVELDLIGPK